MMPRWAALVQPSCTFSPDAQHLHAHGAPSLVVDRGRARPCSQRATAGTAPAPRGGGGAISSASGMTKATYCEPMRTERRGPSTGMSRGAGARRRSRRPAPRRPARCVRQADAFSASTVLVIAYHLLETGQPYSDLGAGYFDRLDTERIQHHHVKRLQQLGYEVALTRKEVA